MPKLRPVLTITALYLLVAGPAAATSYILEVREPTGANPFARYVYACIPGCTPADFATVTAPAGFEKASAKLSIPSSISATLPTIPGVAPSLDLVASLPGDDFNLVAELLGISIVEFNPTFGAFALAQVQRDTVFTYDAGSVVHEVIDTDDNVYILFSFDLDQLATIDPGQVDSLSGLDVPTGWSYRSRSLSEALVVESGGLANVFAQGSTNAWQRYAVVPEPGTASLFVLGLGLLASRRSGRQFGRRRSSWERTMRSPRSRCER